MPIRFKFHKRDLGCLATMLVVAFIILLFTTYLFLPLRANILLLGIDYTDPWNDLGRSDTLILTRFALPKKYVGMLSIPRDLWVVIPGVGENRVNTAHYFGEIDKPGNGPTAAMQMVEMNFGVDMDYFIRIKFEGFKDVIDAMGGLDIELATPMAGYEAGQHHLTGNKALAFARSRTGADDFFRMQQGQIVLKAAFKQMLRPAGWWRLPGVLRALSKSIDTNVPPLLWPRLGFALLRVGTGNIDSRTITREMTIPNITANGADVLLPRWELIKPTLQEIFFSP